jgi:hypothetical protein
VNLIASQKGKGKVVAEVADEGEEEGAERAGEGEGEGGQKNCSTCSRRLQSLRIVSYHYTSFSYLFIKMTTK